LRILCLARVSTCQSHTKKSVDPGVQERLRTGCDLLWSFVAFDDCADITHKDDVQAMADITMEALHNPHTPRPKDEWVGGEFIRQ
jgi:hypothetical protein